MPAAPGTIETIAIELSNLLDPLVQQFAPGNARSVFAEIGIPLTPVQEASLLASLASITGPAGGLAALRSDLTAAIDADDPPTILAKGIALASSAAQIIQGFANLVGAINGL